MLTNFVTFLTKAPQKALLIRAIEPTVRNVAGYGPAPDKPARKKEVSVSARQRAMLLARPHPRFGRHEKDGVLDPDFGRYPGWQNRIRPYPPTAMAQCSAWTRRFFQCGCRPAFPTPTASCGYFAAAKTVLSLIVAFDGPALN